MVEVETFTDEVVGLLDAGDRKYRSGEKVDVLGVPGWNPARVRGWRAEGRLRPLTLTGDEQAAAAKVRLARNLRDTEAEIATRAPALAELNRRADELAAELRAIAEQERRKPAVQADYNATVILRNTEQARLEAARARLADLEGA